MSNGLLGMNIEASRVLADTMARWPATTEDIRMNLLQAELLSGLDGCDVGIVDEIGDDAAAMAAAIRRAADELSSFSIELVSPASIVAAVAAVHSFRGSDNDAELDRRLRTLRDLVDAATASDDHAANVMTTLLASGNSADISTAMAEIERLNRDESTGAISSNDRRIDDAVGGLRNELAIHAASEEHLHYLTAAFLADANRTPAALLLASLLTGRSVATVEVAHHQGWDYDIAAGWLATQKVDRLTAAIRTAPFPEVAELDRQRTALFAGISGVTDPTVLDQFARRADSGTPAIEVIPVVLGDVEQAARAAQVEIVAKNFGLDVAAASLHLDYMTMSTQTLVASGFVVEDAAVAVSEAARSGRDIASIEELATNEGTTLVDAANKLARAEELGMTIAEVNAFAGLAEHFDAFDIVRGGDADQLVSLADLRFVVNNYHVLGQEATLAAAAFLNAVDLRHRLDSAAQTGSVVGHEPFGRDRDADNKYSWADVALLVEKQETNYALRRIVDQIDVVGDGGALGWVDGNLSEFDFEHVRAQHQAYNLTPAELKAVTIVLDNDWYDPTFWQEHSDSFILGAAVVAGVLAGTATAGVGSGVAGVLISAAAGGTAGAATGASLTVLENAWTGDPLTEDLAENTALAAVGGVAGAGFVGFYAEPAGQSLAVRLLQTVGPSADTMGLVAAGIVDPVLDPFVDDIDVDQLQGDLQSVNYLLGGAAVVAKGPPLEALQEATVRIGGAGLDQLIVDLNHTGDGEQPQVRSDQDS